MFATAMPASLVAAAPARGVSRKPVAVRCAANPQLVRKARQAALGASVSTGSVLLAGSATAVELNTPLQQFVDAVDTAAVLIAEASKKSSDLAEASQKAYEQASPYLDRAGKAVSPVLDTVTSVAAKNLEPVKAEAIKTGTSAASSAIQSVDSFVASQGIDAAPIKAAVSTVVKEAPGAAKAAQPVLESIIEFIVKSDAATLAETGVALYLVYLLLPYLGDSIATTIRGYAGDLNAPSALNLLIQDGAAVLVDVRTLEEQGAKGLLDLPPKNRRQLVSLERATLERGAFKNNFATESKITAVQIAALKATNKGKPLIVLDQNSKQSKAVAKELTSLGFKKVYVVAGGFAAWVNAGLQTKAAFSVNATSATVGGPRVTLPVRPTKRVSGGSTRGRTVDVEVLPSFGSVKVLPSGRQ